MSLRCIGDRLNEIRLRLETQPQDFPLIPV